MQSAKRKIQPHVIPSAASVLQFATRLPTADPSLALAAQTQLERRSG